MILRDRDDYSGWANAADGTLEKRHYSSGGCQNWRHDVVVMLSSGGRIAERDRYTPYGIPFGSPAGDTNFDGTVNITDQGNVLAAYTSYNVNCDFNLDGTVTSSDLAQVTANWNKTLGLGVLSDSSASGGIHNRKGYAGYEFDFVRQDAASDWHVRHRVFSSDLGRWLQRDPAGYVDGPNLYPYVMNNPLAGFDPFGLECSGGGCGGGMGIGGSLVGPGEPIESPPQPVMSYCTIKRIDPQAEFGNLPEFTAGFSNVWSQFAPAVPAPSWIPNLWPWIRGAAGAACAAGASVSLPVAAGAAAVAAPVLSYYVVVEPMRDSCWTEPGPWWGPKPVNPPPLPIEQPVQKPLEPILKDLIRPIDPIPLPIRWPEAPCPQDKPKKKKSEYCHCHCIGWDDTGKEHLIYMGR